MRLDRSGLVENIPYKGAIVKTPPSMEEIENIYQLRIVLEPKILEGSIKNATPRDLMHLQKIISPSRDVKMKQDFFLNDREFHTSLYALSGLDHLCNIAVNLKEHIDIFLSSYHYDPSYISSGITQHQQIVEAIRKKDAASACELLKENILIGLSYLKAQWDKENTYWHQG